MHSLEECLAVLAPYEDMLAAIPDSAQTDCLRIYAGQQHIHSSRTRSELLRDHAIAQLAQAFDGIDGVSLRKIRGATVVDFPGEIQLRPRKLDRRRLSRSVKARHPPEQMAMFDPPTSVFLGYQLDPLQITITGRYITCQEGNTLVWAHELTPKQAEVAIMTPQPITAAKKKRSRVVARDASHTEGGKEQSG